MFYAIELFILAIYFAIFKKKCFLLLSCVPQTVLNWNSPFGHSHSQPLWRCTSLSSFVVSHRSVYVIPWSKLETSSRLSPKQVARPTSQGQAKI